jgi:hypothetical protein
VIQIIDGFMAILYENDTVADLSVVIALQHKKRVGKRLKVALSRTITVHGYSLDEVVAMLKKAFAKEIGKADDRGVFERPAEKVLAQLQLYERQPAGGALKYSVSKSLTIPNVNLTSAIARTKAAFTNHKK